MEGDRPESAEEMGRRCAICHIDGSLSVVCEPCNQVAESLEKIQQDPKYGDSLLKVIDSLRVWSREIPTWHIIQGLNNLLKPSRHRFPRSNGNRKGPFIVFEGIDGSGRSFHMDVVQEFLITNHNPVHQVTFPNAQTKLGRFLKACPRRGI